MLCIHYIGKEGRALKTITVDAKAENIQEVTDFINKELEAISCPPRARMQIDVAIDEIFGNIVNYAYGPEEGQATVTFEEIKEPHFVVIAFTDTGMPYDPTKNGDPDITLSAEDREVGGLGIFLVKNTMDDISYEYKEGKNILKITKNIEGERK